MTREERRNWYKQRMLQPGASFVRGGIGIAKAVTGTGGADAELIAKRTALCVVCPEAVLTVGGMLRKCKLCGCFTWGKVRNKNEVCPLSKW